MTITSQLIVISGLPRSGTTLVNRILCASSKCAPYLPECSFITKQIEQYTNIQLYADKERFSAYFGTHDECLACFKKCAESHLESLIKARPEINGYEYVILKDPMLSFFLPQAQELLPLNTRFVITVRNPLAVVASMKNVISKNQGDWNIKTKVDELFNFYLHLYRAREEANITAYFVRYEDMVNGDWDGLESFLGFPISDEFVLGKYKQAFDEADPFYSPLYVKPVSNERIGAWKDVLSDSETSYVRDVFSGVMAYWQYV